VFLNLLSNAVKWTDRGGVVKVMVEKIQKEDKRLIRMSVIDNGAGIMEHHQSKLFQLFSTFKDKEKNINLQGIGLGLAICKLIVQKFDGQIDFLSEFGKGSTFFFTFEVENISDEFLMAAMTQKSLPNVSDKEKIQQVNTMVDSKPLFTRFDVTNKMKELAKVMTFKTNRILIVDDEEFCLNSIQEMLQILDIDTKFQVDFCINGQEALDTIKTAFKHNFGYKLILTDCCMPRLDGIEATKAIRSFLRSNGLNNEQGM
jgi:CheY-like chemotaxis protein